MYIKHNFCLFGNTFSLTSYLCVEDFTEKNHKPLPPPKKKPQQHLYSVFAGPENFRQLCNFQTNYDV